MGGDMGVESEDGPGIDVLVHRQVWGAASG